MTQDTDVASGWAKDVAMTGFSMAFVSVSNGFEEEGTVTCQIEYKGKVVSENQASGAGASAHCMISSSDLDNQ